MVIGAIVRPFVREVGRYIYQGLRTQDKLVDYTYRKTGLYNRGIVRGIKHGLIAGQIVGGTLNLGLEGGVDDAFSPENGRPSAHKYNKAYNRRFRNPRKRNKYCPRKRNYRYR